jgi:hypothetical protein
MSSDEEMKPRARSLLTSRLEMVEAPQSRLTLVVPEVLTLFFLPMASGAFEERNRDEEKRLGRR